MCYKIESSFVLIHFLRIKTSCTIREVVAVKRKIEKELPSVYVDVSKNSILETISFYPEIFSWEDDCIKRKQTAERYFQEDVIDYFSNTNIDKSIEAEIIQCIKS
jgi:hypothetical protein